MHLGCYCFPMKVLYFGHDVLSIRSLLGIVDQTTFFCMQIILFSYMDMKEDDILLDPCERLRT